MKLKYKVFDIVMIFVIIHIFFLEYVVIEDFFRLLHGKTHLIYILSRYQLFIVVIDLFGLWGLLLPFLSVYFVPTYKRYLSKRLIYSIGKNNKYNEMKLAAKRKICFINCKIFTGFLATYLIISTIYSTVYNKFTAENLVILTDFTRPNLFYGYIVVIIILYLYTFSILTISETANSNIVLIILFLATYIFIGIATYKLIGDGEFSTFNFSYLIGTKTNPLFLLSSLVLPTVLYYFCKREKQEIMVR